MNKAVLIQSDDWEGLFVNGRLKDEGHTLNEGFSREKYMNSLAEDNNFDLEAMEVGYVTDEYQTILNEEGSFHMILSDVGYSL